MKKFALYGFLAILVLSGIQLTRVLVSFKEEYGVDWILVHQSVAPPGHGGCYGQPILARRC